MRLKYLIPILGIALISGIYFSTTENEISQLPQPTNGDTQIREGAEESDNQNKREEWFEMMHSAAPGTDWKSIEYQTSMNRHINRNEARDIANSRDDEEELANGNLVGTWYERGSLDQAGSVFVTEYDPQTEAIYLISAGGTLFKGTRAGNDWEVINQDLRFDNNFLKLINVGGSQRLLANVSSVPHYSDDFGVTWVSATVQPSETPGGQSKDPILLEDGSNHIYMLTKESYWENFNIYKSSDSGESYQLIINLADSNSDRYAMVKPHHSNEVYLIEKNSETTIRFYKIDQTNNLLEPVTQNNEFGFGTRGANIVATQMDTVTRFMVFNGNNEVYQSEDLANSWTLLGQMPQSPWAVGLYLSPSDPDKLMFGELECYTSSDRGANWEKVNGWGAYYNDVEGSLHADMMAFNEFETSNGEPFILISNHGGLSITYDFFSTRNNLGREGLNVSQYYDVVTDPIDPSYIYAGSQDQGFQRSQPADETGIAAFSQVISGDYGHIIFSENDSRMWMVYPGGWITYYANPQSGYLTASWEVQSENETVWIPPLMPSPIPEENAVYLAGGDSDGGTGSYLIKLTYNPTTNEIDRNKVDYDFHDFSVGGTISMMRTSPVNPDHWYVSTTNGRFFYSYDGGTTWDQTIQFVPGGHYLYGASIYPSKLDENTVYFAGSGYSNPAVYKSTDGGQNFETMHTGLPNTLVFELTANEDESLFFAATEAGPYVYVVAENRWFDMSGVAAPSQTYWSVEYLEESQTIRYATYGRGIWDFQIKDQVSAEEPIIANDVLSVYPNPSSDLFNINIEKTYTDQINLEVVEY